MITNNQCTIIDFDDSFTFNIQNELYKLDVNAKVVHYKKFCFNKNLSKQVIIFGPGPGNPNDYQLIDGLISELLKNENILIVGICLGHQLLHSHFGFQIKKSTEALHGETIQLTLPDWELFEPRHRGVKVSVQRYNSLAVRSGKKLETLPTDYKFLEIDNEIIMCSFKNGFSYQFHPESVGTSCPSVFFKKIKQYLL